MLFQFLFSDVGRIKNNDKINGGCDIYIILRENNNNFWAAYLLFRKKNESIVINFNIYTSEFC